ncbi:MAG: DUF374 domain-containing protein [Lentisphaerae bacterium]|nr:DUF374 domain-containing protein [Lentisphaerota bacterium]
MGYLKQKFRDTKKLPDWIFVILAGFLKFLRFCFYRVEVIDENDVIHSANQVVGVTWHNRLLFFPAVFPKEVRKRTVAVVSSSRDGQYIADLIKCFGLRSARGSSSKGGMNAQREASRALSEGNHVSFTPDGPRGPRYTMSKGPIHLASMHQVCIVPVTVNASRYWECKSWDRFQIPKPFCKLTVVIGTPVPIPADLDAQGLEFYRKKVQDVLNEVSLVKPEDIPTAEEIEEEKRRKAAKKAAKAMKKGK